MQAVFDGRQEEAPGIWTFYFKPQQTFTYTAGQFVELTLKVAGHSRSHWFTLSSSPSEDHLAITTRVPAKHSSAYKHALTALSQGDSLRISDALGAFVLPKLLQTPVLFIAGGMGITPVRSMVKWLADTGEKRPLQLVYAVRIEDDILFQDLVELADPRPTYVVNKASSAWGGERGELTAEMVMSLKQPSDETLVYVSGPEPFVDQIAQDLKHAGIKPAHIVLDEFQGYETL